MAQQDPLFCESINDALDHVVKTCGGAKVVGAQLWPAKAPEAAHRLLLACLNEARDERLSPEQLLFVLKLGRARGCHAAINFITREAGYADPQPIEPEDERARLMREYIEATKQMSKMAERMERAGLIKAVA